MKRDAKQILLALALCASGPAAAQPGEIAAVGGYVQEASGMSFPPSVGDFRRVSLRRYTEDGSNESAGYNRRDGASYVGATVYVYPSPAITSIGSPREAVEEARTTLCAQQAEAVRRELASVHPNLEPVEDGRTLLVQGERSFPGQRMSFRVTAPSGFGPSHPPLRSEAQLFCYVGGRWTVKYRFTYAEDFSGAAEHVAALMRELTISIPPEGAQNAGEQ
jgi:hypothetical protein